MDELDDGFFAYNDGHPPLCVIPPPEQEEDCQKSMNNAVITFLKNSYHEGIKNENNILSNGLTVGEASVLYFREMNKRGKDKKNVNYPKIILMIWKSLQKHFELTGQEDDCKQMFNKHINSKLFETKRYSRKILPAIKLFLNEINMKTKGYCAKLKSVMNDITAAIEEIDP